MSPSQFSPGKLAICLEPDSPFFPAVLKIEAALNVDPAFPAPKNLVDFLLSQLPKLATVSEKSRRWVAVLQIVQSSETATRWRMAAKFGTDQNPLNQNFGRYPLAACFLQEPLHSTQAQIEGIQLLLLHTLLSRTSNEYAEHGLINHADTIRRSIRPRTKEAILLQQLPDFSGDFTDYYERTKSSVRSLLTKHPDNSLLNCLRTLFDLMPARIKQTPPPLQQTSTQPAPSLSRQHATAVLDTSPAKHVRTVQLNQGDAENDEPPEFIDIFKLTLNEEPTLKEADPELFKPQIFDEQANESQARTSEYWLRRHHRLIPTDWSHLTLIEQKSLSRFIKEGLAATKIEQKIAAGLIGTMYITGLSLNALLQTKCGPEQTFSRDGIYTRTIELPPNCFTPDEHQRLDLHPLAQRLLLRLPAPISGWLREIIPNGIHTLQEVLHLDPDEAARLVKKALAQLRNDLLQRIRLERIPTALALETTLAFQDPLTTYLLSATDTQAPPKLAYYVAYPAGMLEQRYSQVVKRMLNP